MTQPTDPRPEYPRTPTKADAKAAKAAYKATRPWYKKKRFIIPLVVLVLIVVIAVSTSGGDGGNEPNAAVDAENSASAAPSKKPGNVLDDEAGVANKVVEGKAYVLGDFKIHAGWKVDDLGSDFGYSIKKLEVENLTDDPHQFYATIKLRSGAHRIVASINCIADQANPKDIVLVDCLPDGKSNPYDSITIENAL
jgi:hypothetical protein